MFQFPRFPLIQLCIHCMIHGNNHVSFLIRKSSDLWLCAPTRSLSQLITSFIGSWCQGIPLALFLAWSLSIKPIDRPFGSLLVDFALILGLIKSIINLTKLFTKNFSWLVVFIQTIYYVQFSKNKLVGLNGLEPSTSRLSGVRSNQLSYRPISILPMS